MRKHIREKLIRETGLFVHLDLMKSRRICIAKGIFYSLPKNLLKITAEKCEKSTSGLRASFKNNDAA